MYREFLSNHGQQQTTARDSHSRTATSKNSNFETAGPLRILTFVHRKKWTRSCGAAQIRPGIPHHVHWPGARLKKVRVVSNIYVQDSRPCGLQLVSHLVFFVSQLQAFGIGSLAKLWRWCHAPVSVLYIPYVDLKLADQINLKRRESFLNTMSQEHSRIRIFASIHNIAIAISYSLKRLQVL